MPGPPSAFPHNHKMSNSKQVWNSDTYQFNTGFVSQLGKGVVDLLAPKSGERILDLGCGDGVLSLDIAKTGAQVVGVDSSANFVQSAIERGIDARQMNGESLEFENEFDAVFTSAALHWMLNPQPVADGVFKSLKSGGRYVGEFGGFGNIASIVTAMRAVADKMNGDISLAGPWYYPTPAAYEKLLAQSGFTRVSTNLFYRQTLLPNGIEAWLKVMRQPFFDQFGDRSDEALESVVAALKPSLYDDEGNWYADYVRLRFSAHKD